jgi:saccharopine dehydrogenase (NAD+, L-lysine-forming)
MVERRWYKEGVYNMEQFNPDFFMDELNSQGLPWKIIEL